MPINAVKEYALATQPADRRPGGFPLWAGLVWRYLGPYPRARPQYRAASFAGLLNELARQGVSLAFLAVVFGAGRWCAWRTPSRRLARSVPDALAGSVWGCSERYVVRGELDRNCFARCHRS